MNDILSVRILLKRTVDICVNARDSVVLWKNFGVDDSTIATEIRKCFGYLPINVEINAHKISFSVNYAGVRISYSILYNIAPPQTLRG